MARTFGATRLRRATNTDGEFFDRMYGPLVIPSCQLLERLLTSLLGEGGIREGDPNTALLLAFAEAALRTLEKSQPPHRQQVLPFAVMFLTSIGISAKGVPSLTFVEMLAKRMIGSMADSTTPRNNTEQTAAEQQQAAYLHPQDRAEVLMSYLRCHRRSQLRLCFSGAALFRVPGSACARGMGELHETYLPVWPRSVAHEVHNHWRRSAPILCSAHNDHTIP